MSPSPWSDQENDLIVADYFAMLTADLSGQPYNKTQHRRSLMPRLSARSDGTVEFKHQNISVVLKALGEDWIPGYKPAFNFQMAPVSAKKGFAMSRLARHGSAPHIDATLWCEIDFA